MTNVLVNMQRKKLRTLLFPVTVTEARTHSPRLMALASPKHTAKSRTTFIVNNWRFQSSVTKQKKSLNVLFKKEKLKLLITLAEVNRLGGMSSLVAWLQISYAEKKLLNVELKMTISCPKYMYFFSIFNGLWGTI